MTEEVFCMGLSNQSSGALNHASWQLSELKLTTDYFHVCYFSRNYFKIFLLFYKFELVFVYRS